jgi:inositol-1,3,4-trisphosphate 5/6-kinase / inositol-tetrakisphosphate 1-kinase
MSIIWRKEDIKSKFNYFPFFLQEFINHDATIFKIYVMGADSHIVVRKSLPNFQLDARDPVDFNSQDWKHGPPEEHARDYAGKYAQPNIDVVKRISTAISADLGLTLFGYDIITNIDTGKHAIIDVNYFPDYKGVDSVHSRLLQHLVDMKSKK